MFWCWVSRQRWVPPVAVAVAVAVAVPRPPPTNSAPTITPIGDQTVDERTTAVVSVVASDPDGDNLTLA